MKTPSLVKNRAWELDFLRGFAILMVIVDHSMFDFGVLFSSWANSGVAFLESLNSLGASYISSYIRVFWRPAFLFLFFTTSGICTGFSRNNLLRSLRLAIVAMLVSLVSYYAQDILQSSTFVLFGVLHCMAVIIFVYWLMAFLIQGAIKLFFKLRKTDYNDKIYKITLSFVCFILSVGFYFIHKKYNVSLISATGYYNTVETASKWLGLFFYSDNWWTADYFPIFPFIIFFFFGAALSPILYPNKKSLFTKLDGVWHTPFSFPGRHSLAFYVLGQVVVLSLSAMLDAILI
ncbi:MAG: DUF1624 domain-containing protein [Clostridiales bacterium]|nr:DUF1624 domain-containing protein [Clostridiales bacterium]